MTAIAIVICQVLGSTGTHEEELPKIGDLVQEQRGEVFPWFGVEPMAVWTSFDSGLHVKDSWGYGVDATVTLDYGNRAFLGFRAGVLGWNTRTEASIAIPAEGVTVRQYRIGVFGEFPIRFLELGIGANVGGYRFRREGQNDSTGFFEFQGMLGGRPLPNVWVGILGMQTFTSSNFNHSGDHFYVNYSVGPGVEVRF
jgi:hypothetical protein